MKRSTALFLALLSPGVPLLAQGILMKAEHVVRPLPIPYEMGTASSPRNGSLLVAKGQLKLNNQAWIPCVEEVDFYKLPVADWKGRLQRSKAMGADTIVAALPWSEFEAEEDSCQFTSTHDVRAFARLCREEGLKLILKVGPNTESTGEASLPAWIHRPGIVLRSNDPLYLSFVRTWYASVGQQLQGELWKEGGAVIGVQLEEHYEGSPMHLIQLKTIALSAGLDLPLFLRSGLDSLNAPMPEGELISLHNTYMDGLWRGEAPSTEIQDLPGFKVPENEGKAERVHDERSPALREEANQERLTHLFVHDFGGLLASMESYRTSSQERTVGTGVEEDSRPQALLRCNGESGFLFLRTGKAVAKDPSQLSIDFCNEDFHVDIPVVPARLPKDHQLIWPLNLPLTDRITLGYATATPLCLIEENGQKLLVLGAAQGLPTEIGIRADYGVTVQSHTGKVSCIRQGNLIYDKVQPGLDPVLEIYAPNSPHVRIVVLPEAEARCLHRLSLQGRDRIVLWDGLLLQDKDHLELLTEAGHVRSGRLLIYPDPHTLLTDNSKLSGHHEGIFTSYEVSDHRRIVAAAR